MEGARGSEGGGREEGGKGGRRKEKGREGGLK